MLGKSLGGGTQPCLPSPFPHHAQFPFPLGSLPGSHLAHALYPQVTCTHYNLRAGAGGARTGQWKERATPPVIHSFPQDPQHKASGFHSFSSLSSHQAPQGPKVGRGQARIPEGASSRQVSKATETPPHCILPHRGGFQGFFQATDENLATVEKLTKSFHAVHGFSFSFLKPRKMYQICVNEGMPEGGQFCFMTL